ncbi:hypothetical protein ADK67_48125 [Saccharothrix sp. NRRL B-16348]|nr:hypothetical protein ADK67_48125 [Saccharothrix sp. NRRL B-16348]
MDQVVLDRLTRYEIYCGITSASMESHPIPAGPVRRQHWKRSKSVGLDTGHYDIPVRSLEGHFDHFLPLVEVAIRGRLFEQFDCNEGPPCVDTGEDHAQAKLSVNQAVAPVRFRPLRGNRNIR